MNIQAILDEYEKEGTMPRRVLVDVAVLRRAAAIEAERDAYKAALEKIDRITTEWDANKLGGVDIQRKRWLRCGTIAMTALSALEPK